MTFLIWQISLFLFLAALLGMIIGWFLHAYLYKADQDNQLALELGNSKKRTKNLKDEARQIDKQLATSKTSSTKQKSTKRSPTKKTKKSLAPDDLKEIKGIGESIESVLHDAGVTTFAQIAKLNKRQKEDIAKRLKKFADRIGRDRWVEQAKALHKEKYGENP